MELPRGVFFARLKGRFKACVSEVVCKVKGLPVRVGDVVIEDSAGDRQVMSQADFLETYRPESAEATAVRLEGLRGREPRDIERAWVDVDICLSVALERATLLQTMRGARKETAEAAKKLREALMWLRARPPVIAPLEEIAKAADALASQESA